MQLESFLESSARQWPDKTALVVGNGRWTFAQLEASANVLAHGLLAAGLQRGDRVAIYLENGFEAVVSVFAVLKAGAVFMMINPTTKADKLRYVLNDSRAAVLVAPESRLPALERIWPETPHLRTVIAGETWSTISSCSACVGWDSVPTRSRSGRSPNLPAARWKRAPQLSEGDDRPPPKRAIDIDLAALIYTSGSTGNPKGVMLTHLNMVSAATSITTYLENTPDDIILNVLPMSFDYGLYQVLMGVKTGGTVVLERSFAYPHAVLQKMVEERVTGLPLVPTMAAILLQMDLSKYDWSSLRYITNTAAALPTEHILDLRRRLSHVRIYSMYGLTECKRVSYLPPEELDRRPNSVGRAMPNEEVYIVDEEGKRVGPGVVGELVVRGSNVMKGYWELPEETDRRLRPGPLPGERVLYTGDLFRTDEEGFLYFVGRKDDIIKSRGEKVSPREVENALYHHAAIAEAVVIGVPDAILGQAIKAVVTLKNGSRLTEREILGHCAGRLEDFMVPKIVEIRSSLPKTANGKIDKKALASPLPLDGRGAGGEGGLNGSSGRHIPSPPSPLPKRERGDGRATALTLDPAVETERIAAAIRRQVIVELRRKGVVLGLSGGVDSSVCAALCVRALGPERVLGLFMPERDSSPESLELGRLLAAQLKIATQFEDVGPVVEAAGCYRRRDEAIRSVFPDYAPGYRCKVVLSDLLGGGRYRVSSLVIQAPSGQVSRRRLPLTAYQQIVAATNFKQRVRKMMEYYHADRLRYAVAGTPNRLEYDQGFFVKNGDGSADLKPIAHLYKTQVYQLAEYLGIPEIIRRRPPTTDTYSLEQSQEEFFFSVPYDKLDFCLYARDHEIPYAEVAQAVDLTPEQVQRVYEDIDAKRKAAQYLHAGPLLVEELAESGRADGAQRRPPDYP